MADPIDTLPSDLADVVPPVVNALRSGHAVCLSDGQQHVLIADATSDAPAATWATYRNGHGGALLLRDASSAMDFVAEPSRIASRLMNKCWPGNVRLLFAQGVDAVLVARLPQVVRQTVDDERGFSLNVPGSPLLQHVLHRVAFPLVKLPVSPAARDAGAPELQPGLTVFRCDAESVATDAEIRLDGNRWTLLTAAGLTPKDVAAMTTERILFVCTGNTCRSPMAAAMLRHKLAERLHCREPELIEKGFEITSAGLSAAPGLPASPESVDVCRSGGVDLTSHSSQPLTESLLFESDRIYTMTAGHREAIVSRYPELEDHVRLLSPDGEDVSDPMGWGVAVYEQCHREIAESVESLVEELIARP